MWFRILTVAVFVGGLAAAFFYYDQNNRATANPPATTVSEEELKTQLEAKYDEWWKEKENSLESRLTFRTQFAVIHVGELNTDVLYGKKVGDVAEHSVSINPETKAMYLYREDLVPQEQDRMVLIHDVNSMDVFLGDALYKTDQQSISLPFSPLQQPASETKPDYGYLNEARLFNDQQMNVTMADAAGTIRVEFDNQTKEVKPGQKASFVKSKLLNGVKVRSKIVVTNYGMWDSQDVTYIVNQ